MAAVADPSLYTNFSGLASLKAQAGKDKAAAVKGVAKQFEALYLQMMLKEMRKTSLGEGLLDSKQTEFFREIYDQQLALNMANQGGLGMAEFLQRQLGGDPSTKVVEAASTGAIPVVPASGTGAISGALQDEPLPVEGMAVTQAATRPARLSRPVPLPASTTVQGPKRFDSQEEFVERLWPHAQEAAAKLGVSPDVLIAQAALETGWGRRQITSDAGQSANNLFGIKADNQWQGGRVKVSTLEYERGVAVRRKEPFRAYSDFQQSFQDYADFISSNPRYRKALEVADNPKAYFRELQAAGYATDPHYAKKLAAILESEPMQQARQRL